MIKKENYKNRKNHPKMPREQRAKQFMPFRAVVGLEEALRAKEEELSNPDDSVYEKFQEDS